MIIVGSFRNNFLILIYFCSSALSMRTNGVESFCPSKTMLEHRNSHSYQRQSKKNNRRFAQNRLQISNPYDSKPFFYLLIRLDLFRICQQPFGKGHSLNLFKKLHFLHGSPLKKNKTNRWETFPSDFHSTGALSRWIFWTTIQVSLLWAPSQICDVNSAQFFYVFSGAKKQCDSPRWKLGASSIFSHFFGDPALHTTIIPISHVISFPFPCSQTLQQTLKNSPYSNWLVSKSHHGHGPWHK